MAKTISLQPVVTYPGGVARNADALLRETGGGAVESVNGKVGRVVLTAADVGAATPGQLSGYLPKTELPTAIDTALAQAKASGEFDGAPGIPGKTAYASAQAGGYTDTESNFYKDLAAMQGFKAWLASY